MRRADRHWVERGRGAVSNPAGRFEAARLEATDDGWGTLEEPPRRAETILTADRPRHAITRKDHDDATELFEQGLLRTPADPDLLLELSTFGLC